jgi:hypothetical protein
MRARHRPGRLARCTSNTVGFRRFGRSPERASTSIGLLLRSFGIRAGLALLLLTVALLLTGCDDFYDLVIENYTHQEVIVRVTGDWEFHVRPCSVQIHSSIGGPPNEPVEVEGQDMGGNMIYAARFPPKWKGRGQVYIPIQPEEPSTCPTPITGTYMLIVRNYSRRDASVLLEDVELGLVKGLSTQTFGPLPGIWTSRGNLKINDTEGKRLRWNMKVDYDLGQVPQFSVGIRSQ